MGQFHRLCLQQKKVEDGESLIAAKVASHQDLPQQALHYYWENNVWDLRLQTTFTYTVNGHLAETQLDILGPSSVSPVNRISYTYNSSGNMLEELKQSWTGSVWENEHRIRKGYDASGTTQLEWYFESWGSNAWIMTSAYRLAYQYNSSNQVIEKVVETWNTSNGMYEPDSKTEYHYLLNEWDQVENFKWNGNSWAPDTRTLDYVWYDFSKKLIGSSRSEKFTNGIYENAFRSTCTYGLNDSRDCIDEEYNNGVWTNQYHLVYDYDLEGHNTFFEVSGWNGAWVIANTGRNNFTYDVQGRTLEVVHQGLDSTNVMANTFRTVYSNFFVGIESADVSTFEAKTFPNPVSNTLNIDLKLIEFGPVAITLLDARGRIRLQTESKYEGNVITIPIYESFEKGVYIYKVKFDGGLATGKIIIAY